MPFVLFMHKSGATTHPLPVSKLSYINVRLLAIAAPHPLPISKLDRKTHSTYTVPCNTASEISQSKRQRGTCLLFISSKKDPNTHPCFIALVYCYLYKCHFRYPSLFYCVSLHFRKQNTGLFQDAATLLLHVITYALEISQLNLPEKYYFNIYIQRRSKNLGQV